MPHQAHAQAMLGHATAGAFEQLYTDYRPAVTRYLLGMCGDPLLAEELAQETFVRAAASLLLFRGESTVGTWLFRIARNTYLSWAERQRDAEIDTDKFQALPDQRADSDPKRSCWPASSAPRSGARWRCCPSGGARSCCCAICRVCRTPRSAWCSA